LIEEAEYLYGLGIMRRNVKDRPNWWEYHVFFEAPCLYVMGQADDTRTTVLEEVAGLSNEDILNTAHWKAGRFAEVLWESGEKERAIEIVEALAQFRNEPTWVAEDQMKYPRWLADMYIGVGRNTDAMAVLDKIIAHLEEEKLAGMRHPKSLMILAASYADQARWTEAIETLHLAIDYGAWDMRICCEDYLNERAREMMASDGYPDWWEPLQGNPDFELAKTRMRSIVDAQRANIRALLEQNDFAALSSPWMPAENSVADPG
jgi:tetratricopeptide (TPR) repeat protein